MAGTVRTALVRGAQQVEGAQSVLPVGPSGYALPLDTDETLLVAEKNLDPALSANIGDQLATIIQLMRANNQMLYLLAAKFTGIGNPPFGVS